MKARNKPYTLQFQGPPTLDKNGRVVAQGRWYTVVATNATLQDLCMGPHARQSEIKAAQKALNGPLLDTTEAQRIMEMDWRKPQAHGELQGVRLRWPGGIRSIAPFSSGAAA